MVESHAINKWKKSCHQFEFLPKFSPKNKLMGIFIVWKTSFSFCIIGLCTFFYHYVGWAIIFFRRHGNLLSDVKLAYTLENKHTIIGWSFKNLFVFHNGKLKVKSYETTPCVLTIKMNLEIVIGVINNWAWDKGTHQFWPFCKSYLTLNLPKHSN